VNSSNLTQSHEDGQSKFWQVCAMLPNKQPRQIFLSCVIMQHDTPMILPRAHTACSQTFWCGDSSSCRNNGTAPTSSH